MNLTISASNGVPIYLQIVRQIERQVALGELKAGDELPSVRALAEQILVNPNTIMRAYRELEVKGIVEKRRGTGTYVSRDARSMARKDSEDDIEVRLARLLEEAERIGMDTRKIQRLMQNYTTPGKKRATGETEHER